jgi:predicted PurR-regulated permease PerM
MSSVAEEALGVVLVGVAILLGLYAFTWILGLLGVMTVVFLLACIYQLIVEGVSSLFRRREPTTEREEEDR